jgi:hypothetical protein
MAGKKVKKGRCRSTILPFAVDLAHARRKPPLGGKLAAAFGWIHGIATAVNGDMAEASMMLE